MRDFLDREINIDDSVIFMTPNSNSLSLGRVIKLTPKNVRISYRPKWGYKAGMEYTCIRPPGDIVKVDGPELTAYLLKQ